MIGLLVRSGLLRRRLATALTSLSVALGVMLVTTVLLLHSQLGQHFSEPGRGYGFVVGPPASKLSLVLSSVYHLEPAPGLLPYKVYKELSAHPSSRLAVPLALGDSFRGFPVAGTTDAFFSPQMPYPAAESTQAKLAQGRPFAFDQAKLDQLFAKLRGAGEAPNHFSDHSHDHAHDDGPAHNDGPAHDDGSVQGFEAVVGSEVASRLGLRLGDRIEPSHGTEGVAHDHPSLWTVVGILQRTGTAVDKLVLIELSSFYQVAEHAAGSLLPDGVHVPSADGARADDAPGDGVRGEPGISSVLLFPKGGMHKALLLTRLRKRPDLTVAEVDAEMRRLMSLVGDVNALLLLVAMVATAIGLVSILVSIYNTISERQREFAVLRAIGVRRKTLLLTVMAEATVIAAAGAAFGLVLAHVLVASSAGAVESLSGVRPSALQPTASEAWVFAGVCIGGALAGLLPAWQAYRTPVATHLAAGG